jgi:hypothetical protein
MTTPTTPTAPEAAWPPESARPADAAAPVATAAVEPPCANCETPLVGDYCHACGQSGAPQGPLTVRRFALRWLHEIVDLDSRLLVTLRTLVLRPGVLTMDYLAGRHARHFSPAKLYLLASALYFLVAWPAYLEMRDFEGQVRGSPAFESLRERTVADPHAWFVELMERTRDYFGYARFLSVMGFAFAVKVLFRRPRRGYVEHLVFALHYYAFDFLFYTALLVPIGAVRLAAGRWPPGWVVTATLPVIAWYAYVSARRVYGQSAARSAIKAGALLLGDVMLTGFAMGIAMGIAAGVMR